MISEQIMKQKIDQIEELHKHQMNEQIHKLKIENKFLDGFYKAFNDFEKSEGEDSVG